MKKMASFNNHFTPIIDTASVTNNMKKNEQMLKQRYPKNQVSENPFPIYIISCHGVINYGITLKQNTNTFMYDICNNNEIEPDTTGSNYFTPKDNTYILNTTCLGTDACVTSSFDNIIQQFLVAGKSTRKTHLNEPNYVTFARDIFNKGPIYDWISVIPEENINCSYVITYNNYIEELSNELFGNIKKYNFRHKITNYKTKRNHFIKKYKLDIETDKKFDKTTIKKLCFKHKKTMRMIDKLVDIIDNQFGYKYKISKTFAEIIKFNIDFKKYFNSRPIIGCANFPCIEKKLEFYDELSSTEKHQWMMGVIEISKNTEDYIKKNPNIKLTQSKNTLSNRSIKDQKKRIINNIDGNLLSGYCKHTKHLTKHEWLTQKINYTIENKNAKNPTLSEITNEFGEGIYIIQNCSPLVIWNGNHNRRIIERNCKQYKLFYKPNIENLHDSTIIDPEFDYIENKSDYLNGINEEIINFTQRSLYKFIFKHVKKYNYQIYKYWPQCIEKLDNSAKVIKFKQKVSSNNYVFDYID